MKKYLISFPASAMDISDEDKAAVAKAAHSVIREVKDAGVYVFSGGINGDVEPLMVAADGTVTKATYPQTKELDGGFCVLDYHLAKPPYNGPRRSPKPAAAPRNSASSGMTPIADRRGRSPPPRFPKTHLLLLIVDWKPREDGKHQALVGARFLAEGVAVWGDGDDPHGVA